MLMYRCSADARILPRLPPLQRISSSANAWSKSLIVSAYGVHMRPVTSDFERDQYLCSFSGPVVHMPRARAQRNLLLLGNFARIEVSIWQRSVRRCQQRLARSGCPQPRRCRFLQCNNISDCGFKSLSSYGGCFTQRNADPRDHRVISSIAHRNGLK